MTNTQLKKAVAKAKNVEWHQTVEETFNFSYVDYINSLRGVTAIYEFVTQQLEGWQKIQDPVPNEFVNVTSYFQNIKDRIESFVQNYSPEQETNLDTYWAPVRSEINNLRSIPMPYNSPQVEFLMKIFRENATYFTGAYNFITNTNFGTNSKELFFGAILAYEFSLKDYTQITSRLKPEQKSIGKLKIDFQDYLTRAENQLIKHLADTNKNYTEYAQQIDTIKTEKEELFSNWFEDTKIEKWQTWFDAKILKLEKLEETYETKLKLEKPAKYWEKKSSTYYKQGESAKVVLIVIVCITALFLGVILILSPDWIFLKVFNGNATAIIRWSLVFVTLLTLIAFSVKAITKYMFSSYHLARDAEERHTLTFFYLALLKDTEVSADDRKLILQSLFSRVETGLLKDDSSPTMPNDILNKVISK